MKNNIIHMNLLPYEEKLFKKEISEFFSLLGEFKNKNIEKDTDSLYRILDLLKTDLNKTLEKINKIKNDNSNFNMYYANSETESEKRIHILDYVRNLGATENEIKEDDKAFSRWFGYDAVMVRFNLIFKITERKVSFCLARLKDVVISILKIKSAENEWKKIDLEKFLDNFLRYDGDERIRIAAMKCLTGSLRLLDSDIMERSVSDSTLQFVYKIALDHTANVWIQAASIELLSEMSLDSFKKVLALRFERSQSNDDIFVRARAVRTLAENIERLDNLDIVDMLIQDKSPFVRKTFTEVINCFPFKKAIECATKLIKNDDSTVVRASTFYNIPKLINDDNSASKIMDLILDSLTSETDPFVLRMILKSISDMVKLLSQNLLSEKLSKIIFTLKKIHTESNHISIRRYAAMELEKLWCEQDKDLLEAKRIIQRELRSVTSGSSISISHKKLKLKESVIGRICSIIAQNEAGFDIEKRYFSWKITRGDRFKRRFWRIIYEFLNPAPDKRQAFLHTTGRYFSGTVLAPSSIMAELSETKVPGEALFQSSEEGWRPYLPLPDLIISILKHGNETKIYTPEGVTLITPPSFIKRIISFFILSFKFSSFASMRNWKEDSQTKPSAYIDHLRSLGLKIEFKAHYYGESEVVNDEKITRFFAEEEKKI